MAHQENKVKLLGMWASPFSLRVELGLKVKGIPYEYVEEDLKNKSPLILKYNPVQKSVPVLIHDGKAILESLVILEYIDEAWITNAPKLLPDDPFQRAKIRFWGSFLQQQIFANAAKLIRYGGESQENTLREMHEKLKLMEDNIEEIFPGGNASMDENKLGFLDLIMSTTFRAVEAIEEAFGAKILDPEKTPQVYKWSKAINDLPIVKEIVPPLPKLVQLFKVFRENSAQFSVA